jgi:hypothetical protein
MKGPAEACDLAELCCKAFQKRYAEAVRLFADAFTADPELAGDLQVSHRYNAACAAALAAAGKGAEADKLTDHERAALRKQALQWLRADLSAWANQMNTDADKARPIVQRKMAHWKKDTDLVGVRDPMALPKLPPDERDAWENLWKDVEALGTKSVEKK